MNQVISVMSSTQPIDNVIINLKVLSAIKPGDRVTMSDQCFNIQESGLLQPIRRAFNGDTRWINLKDIQVIVDDSIRLLGTYVSYLATQRESSLASQIKESYKNSKDSNENTWVRRRKSSNDGASCLGSGDDDETLSPSKQSSYVQPNEDNCVAQIRALSNELNKCNVGLLNLKKTYEADMKMVANIDVLVQKITLEIIKAEKILKAYTED